MSPMQQEPALCSPSLRALCEHLIDYAGLFPPAKLDMPSMVRTYAEHMQGPYAWMIERVVVPAGRLDEFSDAAAGLLPTGEDAEPWPVSALVTEPNDPIRELDLIAAFNARHAADGAGAAEVDVIEVRGSSPDAIDDILDEIPETIFPFFELPADPDPRGLIATLVGGDAGAKIRTGGLTPDLYPSPEHTARFVHTCAGAGVPLKATAGMHHPLRHHSEAVGADEFGFLNFFLAAALAAHRDLDVPALVDILTMRTLDSIEFADDAVVCAGHRLTINEIDDTRLHAAVSFGSCSIDEPIADLRALDLLT